MKRKLLSLLLTLVMALSLVGCADDFASIIVMTDDNLGVIGGADGPTGVFVTDGEDSWNGIWDEANDSWVDEETSEDGNRTTNSAGGWVDEEPGGYDEPAGELPAIDEDGTYSSAEDVSLYLYTYGHLPENFITKSEARDLGWEGGSVERYAGEGCAIGGDRFGNREGLLPAASGRQYYECDIDTVGTDSRGEKRIVYSNDGLIYYTGDHYKSFTLLYGEG